MNEDIHEVIEIARPVTLAEDAKGIQAYIDAMEITDQASYDNMVKAVQTVKVLLTKIVEHHADMKKKADAAHKAICKAESDLTRPLVEAEKAGKKKITARDTAQENIRLEAEAKLRREAQEREDKERLKLAAKLEKKGDEAGAMAVLDAPSAVPLIYLPVAPKNKNVTYREEWGGYEVLDFAAIPDEFKTLDEQKARKYGIAMKGDAKVNGLRFFSVKRPVVKK